MLQNGAAIEDLVLPADHSQATCACRPLRRGQGGQSKRMSCR
jgi:hypothetical protein